MTVTLQNVDSQFFEVLKNLVKMRSDIKIFKNDDSAKNTENDFFSRVDALKAEYADLFNDPVEAEALNHVFDNVRDKTEKLRGTEEDIWG